MTGTLRLATGGDARVLSAIHHATFDEGWSKADFATWLARREAFCVVLEQDGAIAAFGLALAAGDDAELLSIATAPSAQRSGAGRRVFRALDEEAAARGLGRWVLEAARNNLPALALYRSEGFVEIGVRPGYYRRPGGPVDAIVFGRPVGSAGGQAGA